nr:alpha/beta fold hydrolase [Longispora albida]
MDRVVFESPGWDVAGSAGRLRAAARVDALAGASGLAAWDATVEILGRLGTRRNELYVRAPEAARRMADCVASAPFPAELWARCGEHGAAIAKDSGLHESLLPSLGALTQPALLILGGRDPVAGEAELAAFGAVRDGRAEVFPDAGHFVHLEEQARCLTEDFSITE